MQIVYSAVNDAVSVLLSTRPTQHISFTPNIGHITAQLAYHISKNPLNFSWNTSPTKAQRHVKVEFNYF